MPSEQMVERTQEYWEERLGQEVHPCEAYRAARNMATVVDLLRKWSAEESDADSDSDDDQADLMPSSPV